MEQPQKIKEKILCAPDSPGVYLMRDNRGKVIYVGKANSLKKRLASYSTRRLDNKTVALMSRVVDIEFRLSPNEAMALLLEANFIRKFKPRYNISLRDDKSFPFVRISGEEFPSISITRKKDDPVGRYLGPYTNTKLLKNALKIVRRSFAYRSCRSLPRQSCVYGRINLCPAPCVGRIGRKEYSQGINNIIFILEGKVDLLIHRLSQTMQNKSRARDFEAAAMVRDQISTLAELAAGLSGVNRKSELEDLKNKLGLKKLPERIEGFDISNISGKQAVGSMVSFYCGNPDKNNYRRFRIKGFQGIDDYKMLAEVVHRRYSRLIKEKGALPDLLLIDGGKGHLLAADRQLKELRLNLPLVSIAKEEEHIYSSEKLRPLSFLKDTPALNLIRRVRDEAHRFAVGYHLLLRRKELIGR
ncbi:MAG: GIY-YIG nuclease family protein [Candidatus Omnitrophica bacterium]|nr:GIY-YIG nuclease family protein [Candidatus Omnitrophota bacterium]MBU1923884.1 GIY-YIG nuclease family protein [Candidatus Omnitrophota bacterium]